MALHFRKRRHVFEEANIVAEEARKNAARASAMVRAQQPRVNVIVSSLSERRRSNNFGDDVTLSFTPRKA